MPVVKILTTKSYLAMVRNAAKGENRLFRNLYATVDGVEQDVLRDGELSCAVFVSSLLTIAKLIDEPHATVANTEKALAAFGWTQIPEPREGAVLEWSGITYADGETHKHIGFFVGNGRAISNDSNGSGIPIEHSWNYDGTRPVEHIWWHPTLDSV